MGDPHPEDPTDWVGLGRTGMIALAPALLNLTGGMKWAYIACYPTGEVSMIAGQVPAAAGCCGDRPDIGSQTASVGGAR